MRLRSVSSNLGRFDMSLGALHQRDPARVGWVWGRVASIIGGRRRGLTFNELNSDLNAYGGRETGKFYSLSTRNGNLAGGTDLAVMGGRGSIRKEIKARLTYAVVFWMTALPILAFTRPLAMLFGS